MKNLWVYKCNKHSDEQGDWCWFFRKAKQRPRVYGGTRSTGSPSARLAIWEVEVGDLVLCYQVDRRAIVGVACVADLRDARGERDLVLEPVEWFADPYVTRGDGRIKTIAAFQRGPGSSMFAGTTRAEAKKLLRWCGATATLP